VNLRVRFPHLQHFRVIFLSAEREVALDDLSSAASAEEMDKEENDRNDKQKVNQRGSHMEDDKCSNPRKEQTKRDSKEYKSHQAPF
jgi:hypothetical protein